MENLERKELVEKKEEKGASMVEYVLMAALIAVVALTAVTFLGVQTSTAFSSIGSTVQTVND